MTSSPESVAADPWRCARCAADRAADDEFCGRCGAPRPDPRPAARPDPQSDQPAPGAAADKGRFPVGRALILNGVLVGAVLLALLLGRSGGGPTTIAFEPALWACDGSERAWIAAVPASAPDVRLDWLTGGPVGQVHASSTTSRSALEPYGQPDGRFRVVTTTTDAPECDLGPGTYTLTIRDAASNALLASGTVELAPAP
jgi:hypothetical protein